MSLAFDDLHYTVKVKNQEGKTVDRKLLNGISGYVKPGQLTALMGASGAGKTTLMDVIAGRKTAGKIRGHHQRSTGSHRTKPRTGASQRM